VLNNKVPSFDLLKNQIEPFSGFGDIIEKSNDLDASFNSAILQAKNRCREIFSISFEDNVRNISEIDKIISHMWCTGWNPEKNDINLFVCDFGLIYSNEILSKYGGEPIYRSKSDLNHFSIYWKNQKIEVFPFHRTLKCLWHRDDESLLGFYKCLFNYIK
jgi:hypothetical protein